VAGGEGAGAAIADASVYADGIICNDASGRAIEAGVDFMYFTFSGLDDSLTYNVSGGYDRDSAAFNCLWSADGQFDLTDNSGTAGTGAGFANLTNLSTDGSGNLVIAVTGEGDAAHIVVGAVTVEAIPEPGTIGLVAVFGGGILLIRRRFIS
jgi:hypothetical protein